jgi:glycosyltransferase A (GT-A) superfamily protein (DUF2064 family)
MAAVHRQLRLRHRGVVLIGADAPQIEPELLNRAADWLASDVDRLVLGRADDGGFWLFGSNRNVPEKAWMQTRYSTPDTAARFIEAMDPFGTWLELDCLRDIDTFADIAPVYARLAALERPTIEQRELAALLGEHIDDPEAGR